MSISQTTWIAFHDKTRIAMGIPQDVAKTVDAFAHTHPNTTILVFDTTTSQPVDLDAPGSLVLALHRLPDIQPLTAEPEITTRTAGRPKLGVTAKEVTLLPRHWEWLATQPGGASVALRKLVEQAQRANKEIDRIRTAREATYRFINAMAGDEPGFEEATRALFAGDTTTFNQHIDHWPADIREHTLLLASNITAGNAEP